MALIEREALESKRMEMPLNPGYVDVVSWEAIQSAPVIDAAPVVHGRWIIKYDGPYKRRRAYCSACQKHSGIGGIITNQLKPYCPSCGARMDGGEADG